MHYPYFCTYKVFKDEGFLNKCGILWRLGINIINKRAPVSGYRLLSGLCAKLKLKNNHYLTPCIRSKVRNHYDYF